MAREPVHQKLLASYVALIAIAVVVTLWLSPSPGDVLVPAVAGAAIAAVLAGAVALVLGRRHGRTLDALAASVRGIAAGRAYAIDPRRAESDDELSDLSAAVGELSRSLGGERRALAGDNERLRTVLDGMSEGVALLADGRIAFANPAFSRLLGADAAVEGRTPLEAARRHDLAAAIAAVGAGTAETRDIAVQGGRVLQVQAAPLARGVVVVLLDVTEARSLERMRREFVANASHELRTPVAAIRAAAETLASSPGMSPDDRARFEGILLRHSDRLGRLLADLLDLSRAEAGDRPRLVPVDVAAPLASALAVVRDRAASRRLRLTDHVASDLPRIAADAGALEQVLVNLLDNAVKYTPEGGRVEVRLEVRSEVRTDGAGDRRLVRIEVEDTGIGIPAEHLPRIFERFYRVDPARSRELGGTGLGLAIVKHLVSSMGGEIGVTSRVGAGTVFRVTFPAIP